MSTTMIHQSTAHLASKVLLALLAGCLVRVNGKVLAYRDAGQEIDDGESLVRAELHGIYQRIDSTNGHTWLCVYSEAGIRDFIETEVAAMNETDAGMLSIGMCGLFALAPKDMAQHLNLGLKMPLPPTTIY